VSKEEDIVTKRNSYHWTCSKWWHLDSQMSRFLWCV